MEVDHSGWRHPRPASDPRLVCLSVTLAWVAFAQTFIARPDSTVAARAYSGAAAIGVAVLVLIACGLLLYAAFCRSQWRSWCVEAGASICFSGQAAIQFVALVSVNDQWWATGTLAWTVGWGVGNAWRASILIRRIR